MRFAEEMPDRLCRFRAMHHMCVATSNWEVLKRIYQTKFENYRKDLEWSFDEFIGILGGGIVTSHGTVWRDTRKFMTPVLKTWILDSVPGVSERAVARLSEKLSAHERQGATVEMEEEFRLLTLQVIGEILLSLPAPECDSVFPALYLPIMAESNRRVLAPWRRYLFFLPNWWLYPIWVHRLNVYLRRIVKNRWRNIEHDYRERLTDPVEAAKLKVTLRDRPG